MDAVSYESNPRLSPAQALIPKERSEAEDIQGAGSQDGSKWIQANK
jgi:hypothetical protein